MSGNERVRRQIQKAHLRALAVRDEAAVSEIITALNNPKPALIRLATAALFPGSGEEGSE